MDFSFLKQLMKSRKGVYAVSGIVGVAAIGTAVVIGLSQSKSVEEVNSDLVFVEEAVTLEQELHTEEVQENTCTEETEIQTEAEELVSEEITSEEVVDEKVSESSEEKKMARKNLVVETPKVELPETEGVPLVQDIPYAQDNVDKTQKVTEIQNKKNDTNQSSAQESSKDSSDNNSNSGSVSKPAEKPEQKDEYKLIWMDEFDGTKLNTEDWNYEYHEPGWVNNELQEYVDSSENIYVKDGKLVIQAIKTEDENGNVSYTSGRINTQNKHDYKYGRFEARAKVPSGKGFLPAFWMMPTDESFYGQWPKCGEIDIMEVLGDNLTTSHGTLHFGEPHTQSQGSYTLKKGDFANEFHVFACEWEPGEIRFYVDGNLFHTEKDWFTKRPGYGEIAYPAPYDQPFYMILNLAVGGDWPGNPEPDAVFAENAQLVVDYVKVYQKDSYDENVTKPEKQEVILGKPDATGNFVRNGDFSIKESLTDADNWQFMLAGKGKAAAEISNNALHIETTDAGELDYSVQVVQAKQSLEKGYQYRLSFDAYADEARTIITGITAPDLSYSRYMADTKVNLTTASENYSFTFDMTSDSDANGRVEFNLGNQGSTATVHITNVRLEKVCEIDIPQEEKTVLPDGNYVYNGEFQQGADRLDYWEVKNSCDGATVVVTNDHGNRELKATIPATVKNMDEVQAVQEPIAISGGKTYVLTFDAYADSNKSIKTVIAGKSFESELSTKKTTYRYTFETPADMKGTTLSFQLGVAGTIFLDNVRVQEDGLLVNGDFSNGTTGYEVYAYTASDVSYIVDSLNEDNAFSIDIKNTGDSDWKIQLKQNNIALEKGKWYKLSFKAKSTMDRKLMYALQKDGTVDNDWTPYSGNPIVDLTSDYQTFSKTFQMTYPTDEETILSISMGAVGGIVIDKKHTIVIDSITLEEVTEPEKEPEEEIQAGKELVTNGDFKNGSESWGWDGSWILVPAQGSVDFSNEKAVFDITNPGEADWNVQLKQSGLTLEKGATYKVSFDVKSTKARTIKLALMTAGTYDWYDGADIALNADEDFTFEKEFTVTKETSDIIDLQISMGLIAGVDTPASVIELDNISLVKLGEDGNNSEENQNPEEENPQQGEMIANGNFANGIDGWENAITSPGEATADFSKGKAVYTITNVGTADWNVQLKKCDLTLEKGATYRVKMKLKSSESRVVKYAFLDPEAGYAWYGGEDLNLVAGETKEVNAVITVDKETSDKIQLVISMGKIDGADTPTSTIEIDEVSLVKEETVQMLSLKEDTLEETLFEEDTVTEESKDEDTVVEETTKKEDSVVEENSKKEDTVTEENSKKENSVSEENTKKEDIVSEEDSKKEDIVSEENTKKEDTVSEENSKKEDTVVEETSKKEETVVEEKSKDEESVTAEE